MALRLDSLPPSYPFMRRFGTYNGRKFSKKVPQVLLCAGFAIPSNFSLFAAAVQLHEPGIRCTLINIADGGALPFWTSTV
jgi:hypothetical protein